VWQSRLWEHTIHDPEDYNANATYCHLNPVKHGYVARPEDWPFSPIHRANNMGRMDGRHVGRDLSRQSAGAAG
jgi:putative transposase